MARLRLTRAFSCLLLGAIVGVSGCGGSATGTVSGTVTYNGSPLNKPNGKIVFMGSDGTQAVADIGLDGKYQATGVARGANKVAVSYPNPNARTIHTERGHVPKAGKPGPAQPKMTGNTAPFLTPIDYANPDTSNLTVTVDRETTYDPALTGPEIK